MRLEISDIKIELYRRKKLAYCFTTKDLGDAEFSLCGLEFGFTQFGTYLPVGWRQKGNYGKEGLLRVCYSPYLISTPGVREIGVWLRSYTRDDILYEVKVIHHTKLFDKEILTKPESKVNKVKTSEGRILYYWIDRIKVPDPLFDPIEAECR